METIDDIVEQLLNIKDKHGNLFVGQIFYGSDDYPNIEVVVIKACVVSNPLDTTKYIVTFD